MADTFPLPLDRLAEIYVEFSSTSLEGGATPLTVKRVTDVVAAVDEDGEVIKADQEKFNYVPGAEAFAIEVGMHVLAFLIGHGMIHVGRLGWKKFWSRSKSEIVKDTKVNVTPQTEPVIDKAIPFLRDSDPNKLADGWKGETKP